MLDDNLPSGGDITAPDVVFTVDGGSFTGKNIKNKVAVMNQWDFRGSFTKEHDSRYFAENMNFVEYIQFMTATGGNKERDLFKNPLDLSVMDDYDFSPLVTACANVLAQGVRPFIKTGNIPLKYSAREPEMREFRVNIFEPADYDVYYNYIAALAETLAARFGLDEVRRWKWGVFTEYENSDWFVGDNTPQGAQTAYCKIYDYTVAALTGILGDDIYIGAHSMTCSEGMWDERRFIKHCAVGTNYATGKTGTHISYLAISFYDIKPGKPNAISLAQSIEIVRKEAESYGLRLEYGVDEGRILFGSDDLPLTSRVVGYTYQAGYDARLIKQMTDYDIDYFAAWNYTSGSIFRGIKTVSHHVASCFYNMVGSAVTGYKKIKSVSGTECDLISSYNKDTRKFHLMAYCFKDDINYSDTIDAEFRISLPEFDGDVTVTRCLIDDDANFFDKWRADNMHMENNTGWSADSAQIILPFEAEKYKKYAELVPTRSVIRLKNNSLTLNVSLTGNAVVFYTIEQI